MREPENSQAQPRCEPQRHTDRVMNTEPTRPLTPEGETREYPIQERRVEMPVEENRGEEQLLADAVPSDDEQEDVHQQREGSVDPPTIPVQPTCEEPSSPQPRRSTRDRRPTQMFTYGSLGQPSYQSRPMVNTVGAYETPTMPFWEMGPHPMTYHNPFNTLPYPIPYHMLPYPSTMPYSVPRFVY